MRKFVFVTRCLPCVQQRGPRGVGSGRDSRWVDRPLHQGYALAVKSGTKGIAVIHTMVGTEE